MRIRNAASFLVFAGIIVSVIAYIGSLGVRLGPPDNRTNLSMQVSDLNGLVAGSRVLLRGVAVGEVTSVEMSLSAATVNFYYDNRYRIPVDSDVKLANLSALGETYIGLTPRSSGGPTLQDGQRIAAEAVQQPASISDLAASVARVLTQVDSDQVNRVIGEVDTALPAENAVLPNLTRASALLLATVASMRGDGRKLLANAQSLLQNAGFVGPALAHIGPDVRLIGPHYERLGLAALHIFVDTDAPVSLLRTADFVARIQKFLDDTGGDIRVLGEALAPQLTAIAGSLMNFDTSQLLTNALATVPEDGAISLHVTVPPNP